MRIGLVSDTHDNLPLCARVVEFLREARPDRAFHLGDITTPETARAFEPSGLPVQFLCGNNDLDPRLGPALEKSGFPRLVPSWTGEIEGVRVGATHGHLQGRLRQLRASCDVVLHGHTHRRRAEVEEGVLMVNPGALYRASERTVAILELPEKRVAFYRVDAEGVAPLR